MGYYSFYRIVKDIIKTIFGKKVWKYTLIILIVFIIFFILGEKGVFAYGENNSFSNVVSVKGGTLTLPTIFNNSNYNYYIFQEDTDTVDTYDWIIVFTRQQGILKIGEYNLWQTQYLGKPTFTTTNNKSFGVELRNGKDLALTGTIQDMQTRLNSVSSESSLNWYTENAVAQLTDIEIDFNDCYVYCSSNIYNKDNNIYFSAGIYEPIKYPEIANTLSDLESLNFEVISINAWSWSNKDIDILFYDRNITSSETTEGLYPKRIITLKQDSKYFQSDLSSDPTKNAIYWVPNDETGLNFYIGGKYEIRVAERVPLQRWWWI